MTTRSFIPGPVGDSLLGTGLQIPRGTGGPNIREGKMSDYPVPDDSLSIIDMHRDFFN